MSYCVELERVVTLHSMALQHVMTSVTLGYISNISHSLHTFTLVTDISHSLHTFTLVTDISHSLHTFTLVTDISHSLQNVIKDYQRDH